MENQFTKISCGKKLGRTGRKGETLTDWCEGSKRLGKKNSSRWPQKPRGGYVSKRGSLYGRENSSTVNARSLVAKE